ncbi:aspartate kinase [Ostreibacterium oceani]|uniref:Aspartokinase n=1 Tax=Ostreibacterium oceani TaxID=2654998 RepID=A0A6N7EUZ6_9GAMM|nr:aspartate kinase [Ostreibacterium oceani]MPV85259.1 aspartate kinase [Ostreibacterium oceani]
MAIIVQKYGGTSVGTIERIKHVADRVIKTQQAGHQVVVVVSAMSGETNRLLALASEIATQNNPREVDVLVSTGEQVTIALLAMAIQARGFKARSYTGGQVRIITDDAHSKARIKQIDDEKIQQDLQADTIVIVAGFQGTDEVGNITTLGRGGSDTTAVALAAALKADECQIYTDVDGVYTTDPRIEPQAKKLDKITFEEMLEMASLGSKVLQIRAVEFAGKYNVPLRVLSSFETAQTAGSGTLISLEDDDVEAPLVSGIAFSRDEAQIKVTNIPDKPGAAFVILALVSDANIEVDMIVQNASHQGIANLTFTVPRGDYQRVVDILHQAKDILGDSEIIGDDTIVKVSLVGVGMRSHAGVATKMFQILANENINIKLISTSEIKISTVIDEKYLELAVRALHKGFGLAQ